MIVANTLTVYVTLLPLKTDKTFDLFTIRFGIAGETNVQGEEVKKLDVLANELFINMLRASYTVALLISEENETVIEVLSQCYSSLSDLYLKL